MTQINIMYVLHMYSYVCIYNQIKINNHLKKKG